MQRMMMAASSDSPLPLVVVILTLSLLGCRLSSAVPSSGTTSPTGTSPTPPTLRPRGSLDSTEDYDNFSDEPLTTRKPVGPTGAAEVCDYDVCREDQIPCSQLKTATGCFCPGVSSYNDLPEAPVLKTLSDGEGGSSSSSSEVTVAWCAPYSSVNKYIVTVGGKDPREFAKDRRSGAVGQIDHVAQVCVVAVNDAGESPESCAMYRPGDDSASLKAGLIGGALGFLLLLSLALLLWRHRVRRKAEARICTRSAADIERTE